MNRRNSYLHMILVLVFFFFVAQPEQKSLSDTQEYLFSPFTLERIDIYAHSIDSQMVSFETSDDGDATVCSKVQGDDCVAILSQALSFSYGNTFDRYYKVLPKSTTSFDVAWQQTTTSL